MMHYCKEATSPCFMFIIFKNKSYTVNVIMVSVATYVSLPGARRFLNNAEAMGLCRTYQ